MRILLLFVFVVLQTIPLRAAVTPEEMRTFAYDGDIAALEAAMAEAHQQSLRGEISYDDLRNLLIAITTTHPTILETTDIWLQEMPNSPYANALRAFQLRTVGWNIRGPGLGRNIPYDAMQSFNEFQAEGMDHAIRAYQAAPDFVPASDAILRLQTTTKRYPRLLFLALVSDVMEATPNRGSLLRAAGFTQRGWRGRGQRDIIMLCEEYIPVIPDDTGYDVDVCIVDLTYLTNGTEEEQNLAWRRLGNKDHVALARWRAWDATVTRNRHSTAAEREAVESYLRRAGQTDHKIASRYEYSFLRSDEGDALLESVEDAVMADARERIVHDPYNPDLIRLLLSRSLFLNTDGSFVPYEKDPNRPILLARMAVARPFHSRTWLDAARTLANPPEHVLTGRADPYFANAIYYSNHARNTLEIALMMKQAAYQPVLWARIRGEPNPIDADVLEEYVICPVVRLNRLVEHSCRADGLGPSVCPEIFVILPERAEEIAQVIADAVAANICIAERTGTIADLKFQATPVAMDILSEPLVLE